MGAEKRNGVVITEEGPQVEQCRVLRADGDQGVCAVHVWWRVRSASNTMLLDTVHCSGIAGHRRPHGMILVTRPC